MITYIYLIMEDLALRCINGIDCIPVSREHFNFLLAQAGLLEVVYEIKLVIRIYKSKEREVKESKD